ncbi:MAG: putative porin [Bacteroidaceae bacterium]
MRRFLHIYILLLFALAGQTSLYAQRTNQRGTRDQFGNSGFGNEMGYQEEEEEQQDSVSQIDSKTVPMEVRMWTVDRRLGNIRPTAVDTIHHHFQNSNLVGGYNGNFNYLGNLGSPRTSRIFFDRPDHTQFIFTEPYSSFLFQPDEFKFSNTKSPYTNLTYYKAGSKRDGEERFKGIFSVNVNKRFNFGFNFDYLYGRGLYASQSTAFLNGGLFGSYIGDRYNVHLLYNSSSLKMAENGGITDDKYIIDPLAMSEGKKTYQSGDIPTVLSNTWNRNKGFYVFLTQRYNLGFKQDKPDAKKKGEKEFVPVTSFIHTLEVQQYKRRFIAYQTPKNYYQNNYFNKDSTDDNTKHLSVKNTFGISLREGFSKWAKAGLTAFITHEYRTFSLIDTVGGGGNSFLKPYKENVVSVGGEFAKVQGKLLHYNLTGNIALVGEDVGQFNVDGKMDLNFRLLKDTVRFEAHAYIKNTNPAFYFRHFHSNHYWWNNNSLSKEFRTRIEGQLSVDRWRTNLKVGVENVKNYTYFGNTSVAFIDGEKTAYKNNVSSLQYSDNIQVFSATLKQDFKLGILHLDNEITYQKSSNSTLLPLPALSLYHNLYISAKLAKKVLSLEIGADVRYFTQYYAPDYAPGIGQYYLQNPNQLVEIGNYPIINVYANIHLKHTRIFVMMDHINEGMGNSRSFLAPHYPVNPRMFKLGISWSFFN